jgi:tetratricopeptide (TPR) repeat protein
MGTAKEMVRQGLRHHQAGRLDEAEGVYRRALAVEPGQADCLHLLGMVAFQRGELEGAAELIGRAIAAKGDAAAYHSNLGNVLQAQGGLAEAAASYRRALELRPELAEAWLNLGNVLKAQGEVDASVEGYRRALALRPDLAEAAAGEATALLLKGEFTEGWRGFERRWETRDYDTAARAYAQPMWRGERLAAGRVLIWGEQGIGDEVMFAGLVPDALRAVDSDALHMGNGLVLDCDARLMPLFARSFPEVEVVSGCSPQRSLELGVAAHLPSGSLPGLFRGRAEAFAVTTLAYLVADRAERDRFRAKYAAGGQRVVGLAWRTNSKKSGRSRSIELKGLGPLFALAGIRWVSLQYGEHEALEREVAETGASVLVDRSVDQLVDIDRFAAQVAAMDLVVSIDNSTAHLAGALGIPTWVLLPHAPEWRWMLGCEDSLWYPAMRLFRQETMEDWGPVVERVANKLSGWQAKT